MNSCDKTDDNNTLSIPSYDRTRSADQSLKHRIFAERVRLFFGHAVGNVVSAIVGAIVITVLLFQANVAVHTITAWFLITLVLTGIVASVEVAFTRITLTRENAHKWVFYRVLPGALVCLMLGISAFLLPEQVDVYYEMFLFIVLSAVVAVASTSYSVIPAYYIILNISTLVPLTLYFVFRPESIDTVLVASLLIWQVLVLKKAWAVSNTSINAIRVNELLRDEISEHEKTKIRLRHMATHDSLTGLPNRDLLIERLDLLIKQTKRYRQQLALMYIDLDGFKQINDVFGHESGDAVLREIAIRFAQEIRDTDFISRVGGDEFVLICNDLSDKNLPVEILAERILNTLQKPFILPDNQQGQIGGSIGIAIYPQDGEDPEALVKSADSTMYDVKSCGKNNYKFSSDYDR